MLRPSETHKVNHRLHAHLELLRLAANTDGLAMLHRPIEAEIESLWDDIKRAEQKGPEEYAELVNESNRSLIEELLGVAVAAAQVFLTAVRSRCVAIARAYRSELGKDMTLAGVPILESPSDMNGYRVLRYTDKRSARALIPPIEAINAVANFWKHQAEWPSTWIADGDGQWKTLVWNQDESRGVQRRTMEIVIKLGMARSGVWNLHVALKALGARRDYDLGPIRRRLQTWGRSILKEAELQIVD